MRGEDLTETQKCGSINTTMKLRTIKVRIRTWRNLRLLAAYLDGTMVAVLDELVERELRNAKRKCE